ncbi:hypothetical protein LBMAG43_20240 [Methylococcaceae bacterium]|nr:hypothetical protein LBMAG43_20240 [Methylococcaceae bacterium]
MNITHRPPSAEALTVLSALQSAVTKTLDKKQRLGHYAVVWKNGEVTEKHFEDLSFYLDCKQAKSENDFLDDKEAEAFIERLAQ